MPKPFIRKPQGGIRPPAAFLKNLSPVIATYLPEAERPPFTRPYKSTEWKTYRLRPELVEIITLLQARYAAHSPANTILTPSEIIAAAFIEAVPRLTAQKFAR